MSALKGLEEFQDVQKFQSIQDKRIKEQTSRNSGSGEKTKNKSPAPITPRSDPEDQHERLASVDASTPLRDSEENPGPEDGEPLTEAQESQLQETFNYLDELRQEGKLTAKQVDDLVEWAEDEIDNGVSVEDVVNVLKRAKKRERILSLPRFVGRKRIPQIPQHYPRKSSRGNGSGSLQDDREESDLGSEVIPNSIYPVGNDQWTQSHDEHPVFDHLESQAAIEVWEILRWTSRLNKQRQLFENLLLKHPLKKTRSQSLRKAWYSKNLPGIWRLRLLQSHFVPTGWNSET